MLNRKSELIASKLDVENILKDARNELKAPARRVSMMKRKPSSSIRTSSRRPIPSR
jgi:hypothetical protein